MLAGRDENSAMTQIQGSLELHLFISFTHVKFFNHDYLVNQEGLLNFRTYIYPATLLCFCSKMQKGFTASTIAVL